ncbi:MAG: polyprenyl diphosphate synthase [Candidatus Gastranaerophilaceae bacterium]
METMTQNIRELVKSTKLKHIAIIMDGNRRWAKNCGLPSAMGHTKGVGALKETLRACDEFGVKYLTVYAFSTENKKRPPEEVNFLMNLLGKTLESELDELSGNNARIKFLGRIDELAPKLREIVKKSEEKTAKNEGVRFQIAFNYGSRTEILDAVRKIAEDVKDGTLDVSDISEDVFGEYLYTRGMPDPDLVIRTGGEMRISNYLLWQNAYSEIYVTERLWPEFGREPLAEAIENFASRQRRFGK